MHHCSLPSPPPTHTYTHSWITDTYELSKLKAYAEDAAFQEKWRAVKLEKKKKLAAYIKETFGDDVPLNALFDIQVGMGAHYVLRRHLRKRCMGVQLQHIPVHSSSNQLPTSGGNVPLNALFDIQVGKSL
jgi:hypothetical protein